MEVPPFPNRRYSHAPIHRRRARPHRLAPRKRWPVIGRGARGPRAARTPAGLVALALASFALGLAEFVIAGLLPSVSRDLSVSGGTAGLLVATDANDGAVGALV